MANLKNPGAGPLAGPPVSLRLGLSSASVAVSVLQRLRTLEDSMVITVRGASSSVLRVLDTVKAEAMGARSVAISVLAPRSVALNVLRSAQPGPNVVSAVLSLRAGKPAGG